MTASRYSQLELPLPLFERCTKCGQIIRQAPPDDPLGDAILGVLRSAHGRLVRTGLLSDFIGMRAGRTTLWERLTKLEAEGMVERDPEHPRSGWKISRQELEKFHRLVRGTDIYNAEDTQHILRTLRNGEEAA